MTSLYKISEEITNISRQMEESEDEEQQLVFLAAFDGLSMDFNEKISSILKLIREMETDQIKVHNEAARLAMLAKRKEVTAERLKNYVSNVLQFHGIQTLDLDLFQLSFRKSEAVIVDDESKLPDLYIKVEEKKSVDKALLKENLKKLGIIPGSHLEIRQNLQIK